MVTQGARLRIRASLQRCRKLHVLNAPLGAEVGTPAVFRKL